MAGQMAVWSAENSADSSVAVRADHLEKRKVENSDAS